MLRAIHIFPKFVNENVIQKLRENYDPLFRYIPPHITLVFPFESDLSTDDLETHMREAVFGIEPFSILLQDLTGSWDRYLFLNVKQGNDGIIKLHDRLYMGPLKIFLNRQFTYFPHITVGKFDDDESLKSALNETQEFSEKFETTVTEIVSEIITANGESMVETRIPLGGQGGLTIG